MALMIRRYEQDNPHLHRVEGSGKETVLFWAEQKRYIVLTRFGSIVYYTEDDLGKALMWEEKEGLVLNTEEDGN